MKTREPFAICRRPVGIAVFRQQLTRVQIKRGPVILSRPRTQRPLPRGGELIGVDDKITAGRQDHHVVLQAEHVRRSRAVHGERPARRVQRLVQVIRRSGRVHTGPQRLSQHVTVGPVTISQRQQLDKSLGLTQPPSTRNRAISDADAETTQHRHTQCAGAWPGIRGALVAGHAGHIARHRPRAGRERRWRCAAAGGQHVLSRHPPQGRRREQLCGRPGQPQRPGQQPGGVPAGGAIDAPLQVTNRPRAQARRLRQLLLRQVGLYPQLPQQPGETQLRLSCHRPIALTPKAACRELATRVLSKPPNHTLSARQNGRSVRLAAR